MSHSYGGDLSQRLGNFSRNLTAQAQRLIAYWRSATQAAGAEPNTSGIQINKRVNQTVALGSYNITTFISNQALKQTVGTAKSTRKNKYFWHVGVGLKLMKRHPIYTRQMHPSLWDRANLD